MPGGDFRVYRSKNHGDTWEVLTDGLLQVYAFQVDEIDYPGGMEGQERVFARIPILHFRASDRKPEAGISTTVSG